MLPWNNCLWVSGARNSCLSIFATCRSAKESLESSLFAAQQQISHLEETRNNLEAQVLMVMQAKEVTESENLVCFVCGASPA